jgi:long-chain acyl-CoA synthetase
MTPLLQGEPLECSWRGAWCRHEAKTIVELFQTQVEQLGDHTLFLHKERGVYVPVSWRELQPRVRKVAAGLVQLGIQPGDRVVILSWNRLEWIIADLAIQHAGAIAVTIHSPLTAGQIQEQIADSGAVAAFVENEEQFLKIHSQRAHLPALRPIISFDRVGSVMCLDELSHRGESLLRDKPNLLQAAIDTLHWDSLATLIYTSGTTGESKGVMLSHGNLLSNMYMIMHVFLPEEKTNVGLNFLPLSHIYARTSDYLYVMGHGVMLAFAESIETIAQNLQEIRPHAMNGVPRFYEKVRERILQVISENRLYRLLGKYAKKKAIQRAFGGRIRWAASGGAALDPQVAEFYYEHGLPIYQGYGLTETSPAISVARENAFKIGTVGPPLPGCEVKLAADGEILTRGPNLMKGYWNKQADTTEAIDSEGWFHTGDVGEIVDGKYLRITDRKKDLFVLAGGKNITPVAIETALVRNEYIEQAVVYGDKKKFVSALIVPARDAITEWANRQGLHSPAYEDLLRMPETYQLIERQIEQEQKDFAPYEHVRRFVLLPEAFTLQDGDVTITLKMRRAKIIERYKTQLDALYE